MRQFHAGSLGWTVGLISISLLGFELTLMRLLSYLQWYHFASMIISVALIGFGTSGTVLSMAQKWILARVDVILFLSISACALSLISAPLILSLFTLDPFLLVSNPIQLLMLTLLYGALALPFLFGSIMIGIAFLLTPEQIGRIYFFNLAGSGIGIVVAVLLMNILPPVILMQGSGLIVVPCLWIVYRGKRAAGVVRTAVLGLFALVLMFVSSPGLEMSQYKSLAKTLLLPDARVIDRRWGPTGVVEIVDAPSLRYAPGLSLGYTGDIPRQRGIFHDGEWIGTQLRIADPAGWEVLRNSASIVPYRVRAPRRVLVLGAGTGTELLLAERFGADEAIGVEMNSELVALFEELQEGGPNNSSSRHRASMILGEGRSFLSRDTSHYDLIVVPILEGAVSSAAGAQALHENYLVTVESFSQILDRLSPDGMIVLNSWMTHPPRGSVRSAATMFEALQEQGIGAPINHTAVLRSWGTVMMLVSAKPFSESEVDSIRNVSRLLGFDLSFVPGIRQAELNQYHRLDRPYIYMALAELTSDSADLFMDRYPFNVRPPTDNKPYFGHVIRWDRLPELLRSYGLEQTVFFEMGTYFLILTVIQIVILSTVMILIPMIPLSRRVDKRTGSVRTFTYFGGIGLGFMMIEMLLIQKFVLFLGHPIYSVSVVIGTLLLFSGIGARKSGWFIKRQNRAIQLAIGGILILFIVVGVAGQWILAPFLSLSFFGRICITIAFIAPLAFLMGIPFPSALTLLAHNDRPLVPWAWGVNGFLSVVAASSSILVAMEFGFILLSLIAMGAYLLATIAVKGIADYRIGHRDSPVDRD